MASKRHIHIQEYTTVPTGVEEITPGNSVTGQDVTKADAACRLWSCCIRWNRQGCYVVGITPSRVEMLKEVIDTAMAKYPTDSKEGCLRLFSSRINHHSIC